MKKLKIGEWILEVDVEKTRELYEKHKGEKDYSIDVNKVFSEKVQKFFENFGINPLQAMELYRCEILDENKENYSGFYHLIGKMIKGEDCWENFEDDMKELHSMQVNKNLSIGFTNEVLNIEETGDNLIQMEFDLVKD